MDQVNEAFARLDRSDVRYRFVIDMATSPPTPPASPAPLARDPLSVQLTLDRLHVVAITWM
jgi:hypothetical protein